MHTYFSRTNQKLPSKRLVAESVIYALEALRRGHDRASPPKAARPTRLNGQRRTGDGAGSLAAHGARINHVVANEFGTGIQTRFAMR